MNFDIKDVKSWANRHEVKVGDVGYFGDSLNDFSCTSRGKVISINKNASSVFQKNNGAWWAFFLPLNAVKEDKPKEKKYRPLKTEDDLRKLLGVTFDIGKYSITYRNKKSKNIYDEYIYSIIKNQNNELEEINGVSISALYVNFEIYIKNKWVPFGLEIEDKE